MRKRTEVADLGILNQVPSIAALEQRLQDLESEADRVRALLEVVRRLHGVDIPVPPESN